MVSNTSWIISARYQSLTDRGDRVRKTAEHASPGVASLVIPLPVNGVSDSAVLVHVCGWCAVLPGGVGQALSGPERAERPIGEDIGNTEPVVARSKNRQ